MTETDLLEQTEKLSDKIGTVKVSEEVVATIAGMVASEIPGLASMSGGMSADIAEKFGRKNLAKGVKVDVGEKETAVDLYIIVEFGARIPEIAKEMQGKVKTAIESMTGLKVIEVNVHVQGVNFDKPEIAKKKE